MLRSDHHVIEISKPPMSLYLYDDLPKPPPDSFRVAEILPGGGDHPVSCLLHTTNWNNPPAYEAVSYAWGDANAKADVLCNGKIIEVTQSLYRALSQLRYQDRSRFLYADALCINQPNLPERGFQVKQMRLIYSNAQRVLAWLGPCTDDGQEAIAISSIRRISDFLCTRLGVSVMDLRSSSNIYQDLVLKNRDKLPLPNHLDFVTDGMWKSLIWLYSHQYFTRVWVVQEISANHERLVHCGREKIEWELVDLVAGYIIMEPAFSTKFGFSNTNCWWVSTITEMARNPRNWLSILYLASTYSCMDPRDVIYGLRGLIEVSFGVGLLDPDYKKPVLEVYRDSVEVSLLSFHSTDVFTYVTGNTTPSWIPRWNESMIFRNPFRFGRSLPWKPAGTTAPIWDIEKENNILSLTGFRVDSVRFSESYNEGFFSNAMIESETCKRLLRPAWQRILATIEKSQSQRPIAGNALSAVATSFSFGLDENTNTVNDTHLTQNFIAYLKIVLHEDTFGEYIPQDLAEEGRHGDGRLFGKPAWDFQYPESSFFITNEGLFGCSISAVQPGDQLCVALGSTYPMILRPDGEEFVMRGYTYVHGLMNGERQDLERRIFRIH